MNESTLFEGTLPGVFVPLPIVHHIDVHMCALFAAIESNRAYLRQSDDESLDVQMLGTALRDCYFQLHRRMDTAGLLNVGGASHFSDDNRPYGPLLDYGREFVHELRVLEAESNMADPNGPYQQLVQATRMLLQSYLFYTRDLPRLQQRRTPPPNDGTSNGTTAPTGN